ncbi:hypothetical protein D7Z26_08320 [Cohnella endophytica]|uniref:Uncharacterized protein n=1 Tax=Cohnella endophytica TaxID=2419778 RepID=A0A494XXJ6_9BACL|nr:hypothetical protein [Cohnella endophytica]RKP55212.1 hypothetical protein D7Z26_08320 [Cohnella endophytica]
MTDNVEVKRSYTVPILFLIMMVMLTLIIIFYSKYLLTDQARKTDQGQALTQRYNFALLFAERLHDGADGLLNAKTEAERIRSVRMLGEAEVAAGEAAALFGEATSRSSGQSSEEAGKPFFSTISSLMGSEGRLATIGEREGSLNAEETEVLIQARDAAAEMQEALGEFRPLTGEAGYRSMATKNEWVASAVKAGEALQRSFSAK